MRMMMVIYHNWFVPGSNRHCRRLLLSPTAVDPTVCLCCVLKQWVPRNDPCADVQLLWWSTVSTAAVVNNDFFSCGGQKLQVITLQYAVVLYFRWHLEHAVVLHKHSHVDCRVNYLSSPGFHEHIIYYILPYTPSVVDLSVDCVTANCVPPIDDTCNCKWDVSHLILRNNCFTKCNVTIAILSR